MSHVPPKGDEGCLLTSTCLARASKLFLINIKIIKRSSRLPSNLLITKKQTT